MSIAAAENAGLGPDDLLDNWPNTRSANKILSGNNNNQQQIKANTNLLLLQDSTASRATSLVQNYNSSINNYNNNNNNNNSHNNTAFIAETPTSNTICNLPYSSPIAAATANFVSVSNTIDDGNHKHINNNNNNNFIGTINSNIEGATDPKINPKSTSLGVLPLPINISNDDGNHFGGNCDINIDDCNNHITNNTSSNKSNYNNFDVVTDINNINSVTDISNLILNRFSVTQELQKPGQNHSHYLYVNNCNNTIINSSLSAQLHHQQQQQRQQQHENRYHQSQQHHIQHQHQKQQIFAAVVNKSTNNSSNNNNIVSRNSTVGIMNAVASPISTNSTTTSTTAHRIKRRKIDSKANLPQSQINKCNNEKRRREMENSYLEQLAEFVHLNNSGDMTSTKPDKAAILSQVVKTYRDLYDKAQSRDISSTTSLSLTCTSSSSTSSVCNTTNATSNTSTISANNVNGNQNNQTASTISSVASTTIIESETDYDTVLLCDKCATKNCSIHVIQQVPEVSSTEPQLPEPSLLNGQEPELLAYFTSLEHYICGVGWVIIQINADGIIESCTRNIRDLIGYEKQELCRKPLYKYLYPGDHAKLLPILNAMSRGSGSLCGNGTSNCAVTIGNNGSTNDLNLTWGLDNDSTDATTSVMLKQKRSISSKIRMLVKNGRNISQNNMATLTNINNNNKNATNDSNIEQKSMRHNNFQQSDKYEELTLLAAPIRDDGDLSSVLCLITRPEDEPPLEMNIYQQVPQTSVEQMTFKLDVHGKILNMDVNSLRDSYRQHILKQNGRLLQDMCHSQDLSTLKSHLRDVQESAHSIHTFNASQSPSGCVNSVNATIPSVASKPFRLRLGTPDVYVHVKANSRIFINTIPGEGDFIMSVHTLLHSENELQNGNNSNSNVYQLNSGTTKNVLMSSLSPSSSLVSSLVSSLSPMDTNSVSSSLVSATGGHTLGGLIGGGGNGGSMPTHSTQTTNVGGPLMTSAVINGTSGTASVGSNNAGTINNNTVPASQRTTSTSSNATLSGIGSISTSLVNSFSTSPATDHEHNSFYTEFEFDLHHSSFEIDHSVSGWNDSRPNSRASVVTPVSTPRPPSIGHGFSPAVCASPSTPYQLSSHSAASLPSPQPSTSQPSGTGVTSYGFTFPSFEGPTEKLDKDHNNGGNSNNNSNMISSLVNTVTSNTSTASSSLLIANVATSVGNSGNCSSQHLQSATNQQQQQQPQPPPPPPSTESERLRNLLTNKSNSISSASSLHVPDAVNAAVSTCNDDKDNILKFYKQSILNDDVDNDGNTGGNTTSNTFKMGVNNTPVTSGVSTMRMFGGGNQKSSNSNNPMLLSLLKSEDDDNAKGSLNMARSADLVNIKDEPNHHHNNPNNMSPEDLRRMLKIQNDPAMTRKRSLHESDDSITGAKRSEDRPSKLCENNKMLASLLKNPPKNITINAPPVVKTIPDITPSLVARANALGNNTGTSANTNINLLGVKSNINSSGTTNSNKSRGANKQNLSHHHQQQQQQQSAESYLNQHKHQHHGSLMDTISMGNKLQQQQLPPQPHQLGFSITSTTTGTSNTVSQHSPFVTPSSHAVMFPATPGVTSSSASTTALPTPSSSLLTTVATSTSGTCSGNSNISNNNNNNNMGLLDGDPELSKILDSVMDYVTDDQVPFTSLQFSGFTQQKINENVAISAIQKSLMNETSLFNVGTASTGGNSNVSGQSVVNSTTSSTQHQFNVLQNQIQHQQQSPFHTTSHLQPPAYPGNNIMGGNMTVQQQFQQQQQQQQHQQHQQLQMMRLLESMRSGTSQNFQRPPPNYPTRGRTPVMNAIATPGGNVIPTSAQQRYRALAQQQQLVAQQKERLLQQQQKQHMLVPENATARNDQLALNPGLNNIGTLLNTVAPNVSLSRTNLPPDSQISPNFAQAMLQQQLSPNQRNTPFSPQTNSAYTSQFPQNNQRLSPQLQHQQQQTNAQQQQIGFQNASQLSPRQPHFGNTGTNTANIPSPGGLAQNASSQWTNNSTNNAASGQRPHTLQQHNPMLSAQLQSASPFNARQYQQQQQRMRGLNSPSGTMPTIAGNIQGPGGVATLQRQNSFQNNENSFSNTTSNTPSPQSPYNTVNVFQPQQQLQRMQRQTSVPQATQHLPGSNLGNSSDFVKQELRAVVSGRAAAAANAVVVASGSNNNNNNNLSNVLRVTTPQSPLGPQTALGPSLMTVNSTNPLNHMAQSQTPTAVGSSNLILNNSNNNSNNNTLLSTATDHSIGFSFDAQDFFGNSASR